VGGPIESGSLPAARWRRETQRCETVDRASYPESLISEMGVRPLDHGGRRPRSARGPGTAVRVGPAAPARRGSGGSHVVGVGDQIAGELPAGVLSDVGPGSPVVGVGLDAQPLYLLVSRSEAGRLASLDSAATIRECSCQRRVESRLRSRNSLAGSGSSQTFGS
jgi:hypothetical protein